MSIIFPPKLYIGPFNTVKALWVKYEIANMAMVSINVCNLLVNVFFYNFNIYFVIIQW